MIRVLLVEDDPMVRDINGQFLNKLTGFKIVSETNGIEPAKKVLKEEKIDLLLLDIFLPDGSGIDLLKWTRSEGILVDGILITADKSTPTITEAFKYGAKDYLIKPFKFSRFKESLENYLLMFHNLKKTSELNQDNIDELILMQSSKSPKKSNENLLPKGINIKTYESILSYLEYNSNKKLTSEEIADDIGLSRVTVRRYLEKLLEEHKVEKICEYGRIGRPTNYYVLINN